VAVPGARGKERAAGLGLKARRCPSPLVMNIGRWVALLSCLGAKADTETFSNLRAAYAEKHRAYHTTRHIEECLAVMDEFTSLAAYPAEMECALWFHDAIYEPMSSSNEERSADWAAEFCQRAGVAADSVTRIRSHILATRHVGLAADGDGSLVVDIDLAILGSDPKRYAESEHDVRKEYRWVPGIVYRRKRVEILQSFLDRRRIYHWEQAYERFELPGRANVAQAIRALQGKGVNA
jgi:predicted metal-dependent HD superfamily phosphohydrolase